MRWHIACGRRSDEPPQCARKTRPDENVTMLQSLDVNVVVASEMRIELTPREVHALILAVEHAKSTVMKGLQSEQAGWTKDASYLRYAALEAKLKGVKQTAA